MRSIIAYDVRVRHFIGQHVVLATQYQVWHESIAFFGPSTNASYPYGIPKSSTTHCLW